MDTIAAAAHAIIPAKLLCDSLLPLSYSRRPSFFALCGQPLRLHSRRLAVAVMPRLMTVVFSKKKAVAILKGNSQVEVVVTLVQEEDGPVTINVHVTGLTAERNGFHLHEFGDTTNVCISAGAHFNPNNLTHGAPKDEVHHAGDLGNIVTSEDGIAEATIVDNQIPLNGPNSVVEITFLVHDLEDDLGKRGHELSLTT